jgi:hypothetical protein
MTALVTLAGDVGGERSRAVLELVRDPMVGDLGVWQRDPLGVIALVRAVATVEHRCSSVPAQLDAALLEMPGELPRALGYAFLARRRTRRRHAGRSMRRPAAIGPARCRRSSPWS